MIGLLFSYDKHSLQNEPSHQRFGCIVEMMAQSDEFNISFLPIIIECSPGPSLEAKSYYCTKYIYHNQRKRSGLLNSKVDASEIDKRQQQFGKKGKKNRKFRKLRKFRKEN